MSDRELERRVRAWYLEDGQPVRAPAALHERVVSIPASAPAPRRPLAGRRGFVLLAAAALLLAGGAVVTGSAILRESPVVPPLPSQAAIVRPEPSGSPLAAPTVRGSAILRNGNLIAFTRPVARVRPECDVDPASCPVVRIFVAGVDGSDAHELFPGGTTDQVVLDWSPDGSTLLYGDGPDQFLVGARGGASQPLDTGCSSATLGTGCQPDSQLAVSLDGAHVVFVRTATEAQDDDGTTIATMDLASGEVALLSSTSAGGGSLPGWSPDGTRIVFSRYGTKDDGGPVPRVTSGEFVVDADGTNLRRLTPPDQDAFWGSWSPDGERIAFLSPGDGQPQGAFGDVYTIRPDGSDLRRLTFDGRATTPTWTPDGRILYVQGSGSDGFLPGFRTLDPATGTGTLLVSADALGIPADELAQVRAALQPVGGEAIVAPPWSPQTAVDVGPAAPTPSPTPVPDLGPGFAWTGAPPATPDGSLGATATRLADGRVLVTELCGTAAALYDPATGTFTPTGSLTVVRATGSATLLRDGRVLFAGGYNCAPAGEDGMWASAELYDPVTGTFSATGAMAVPRESQTATLLADGRVLIAGGITGPGAKTAAAITLASVRLVDTDHPLDVTELYDPAAGTFSRTGSMQVGRSGHAATLLRDGRVLVTGGGGEGTASRTSAELYDPTSGTWHRTGSMGTGRWLHTSSLLPDGQVLITGGRSPKDSVYRSAELYDPDTGTFSPTGSMHDGRQEQSATVLDNGTVLIAGGYWSDGQHWKVLSSAELYDPAARTFTQIGSIGTPRMSHSAVELDDGRILIVGGADIGAAGAKGVGSAVLYTP
jgi:WD40 repeat protein